MAFELKVDGEVKGRFDSADEAEKRARDAVRANADVAVEIIDLSTGRPYAPAAGAADREAMARKIGF